MPKIVSLGKRHKILHVMSSPGLGGCESLCRDLMFGMRSLDISGAVLFLTSENGPTESLLNNAGFEVHSSEWRGRRLEGMRELTTLCLNTRPSALICYGFGVTHLLVSIAAHLGGVNRIFVHLGNPPRSERGMLWKSTLCAQLARPFCNGEIACSEYVRKLAIQRYGLPKHRVHAVWNCCDTVEIARLANFAEANRQKPEPFVFGMIARMDGIKDHETVLRAFANYLVTRPSILRLVGDGITRPSLEHMARDLGVADRVEFLGNRSDVAQQLGRMDVFVYGTTDNEGFGTVLAEAMAAGLPIICSDIGPCREVLQGGKGGLLVPPKDPNAMAEAMLCLCGSVQHRKELGSTARRLAQELYNIPIASQQYVDIVMNS